MRFLTAGESHGRQLTAIIEGFPAGVAISIPAINEALAKRQQGYGRGERMKIENDRVEILSGVRFGVTTGAPITLVIENKDWENWKNVMTVDGEESLESDKRRVQLPRPGHADLVGGIKYGHTDLRNVLERSSARETAMRVAIGALCVQLLESVGITLTSNVVSIGGVKEEEGIKARIDAAKDAGDTLGGVIEVTAEGVPATLGSYTHWDAKLDGKIAQAVLSINAIKGVEFGDGFAVANRLGSEVMDEILYDKELGFTRASNHLGGFEGGMSNGMPLVIRGAMKPIPTLMRPLQSVDMDTLESGFATRERSDVTAVQAASIAMMHVVATTLTTELLDTCLSNSLDELQESMAILRRKG